MGSLIHIHPLSKVAILLQCDTSLADSYTSGPRKSRVLSELWLESNGYCLSCDSAVLRRAPGNTRATDFLCPTCAHDVTVLSLGAVPVFVFALAQRSVQDIPVSEEDLEN